MCCSHAPHQSTRTTSLCKNYIDLSVTMPPVPQKYTCLCSQCHEKSRLASKRTIEVHLGNDKRFYSSLSAETDFAIYVRLCIIETAQLLGQLHGSPIVLDTAPDAGGSHPDSPEGVLFKNHWLSLTYYYYYYYYYYYLTPKHHIIMQMTQFRRPTSPLRFSGSLNVMSRPDVSLT